MKTNKYYLIIITVCLFYSISNCQNTKKIFYDKEWKICTQENATYYRIYGEYDEYSGSWPLTAYYISGIKQWEGKVKNSDHSATNCSTAMCDGQIVWYYESGKIKSVHKYSNGQSIDKWFIECDEFEQCKKVFFDGFLSKKNFNGWLTDKKNEFESEIIEGDGLLMKLNGNEGFTNLIHLPIDITSNFSIETIIDFKNGIEYSGNGLIWGFKDWENYNYFYITPNGYFQIGSFNEGLLLEFVKWTYTDYINRDKANNLIKLNKIKDKIYFSINSHIIASEDFYTFKGNKLGFSALSGQQEVIFKRLLVRQDLIDKEEISKFDLNTSWKGNGTGFFIDTKGLICTNYHVIEDSHEIEVDLTLNNEKKSFKAKVISADKNNDIAIIKIIDDNFKPMDNLPYALKSNLADVGSNVFVLGYPLALSLMGDEIKFTDGKISSKTGFQGNLSTYQVSVPLQPGNSGSPLFDYEGNIIGVVNSNISAAENVSYAIKASFINNLIEILPENIRMNQTTQISNLSLTEKIKILSQYVVLIKIK